MVPVDYQTPFELLQNIEQRSRHKAKGLPQQLEVRRPWSGMGFRVGEFHLVASLREVNEIMEVPELTRVPHAKPWVKGVANVRGVLLTVLDLRGFIDGDNADLNRRTRVLVIRRGEMNVGLVVDQALGLRHFFDEEQVGELPPVSSQFGNYLLGAYRQGETHWGVFSMRKLVRDPAFLEVAA